MADSTPRIKIGNPGEPTNAPAGDPLRGLRRRRRFWLLIKLLVVLVILGLGAVLYLQSNHALQHIYLPLASRQIGAPITATAGFVHFGGHIRLDQPIIYGTDGEPALEAEQLTLKLDPLSLLPGRTPQVREAKLLNSQAHVRVDDEGVSNWDFAPADRPKTNRAQTARNKGRQSQPARKSYPDIRVDKLEVEELGLDYIDASGLEMRIDSLNLVAQQLARGATGTFGLTVRGLYQRKAAAIEQGGKAEAKGSLTQALDGRELAWDGSLNATLTGKSPATPTAQPLNLQATYRGKAHVSGHYDQTFTVDAATPQGKVGQVKGTLAWDEAKNVRDAALDVTGVSRELLNPILAALGPVQLTQSSLDAHCHLIGKGQAVEIASDVRGQNLSFRTGTEKNVTPPMNLTATQRGVYDAKSRVLRLDAVDLNLNAGGAPVIAAKLDQPFSLDLNTGTGASPSGAAQTAHLSLTINNLTYPTMEPWLAMSGQKDAAGLRGGALSGQMQLSVEQAGKLMTLDGQLNGAGLLFDRWPKLPLDARQTVRARVDELKRLKVEQSVLNLDSGGQRLADVELAGLYDLDAQSGDAQLKLASPQALATLRAFGLLKQPPQGVQDGGLTSEQTIRLGGKSGEFSVQGTANLQGMSMAAQSGPALPLAAMARYQTSLSGGVLSFAPLRLELTQGQGTTPGVVEVKGNWPLEAGKMGEVKLTMRQVDAAPWLSLAQGQILTPLPLEADQTLTAGADGKLKLAGELRVGPVTTAATGKGNQTLALTVRNELDKTGETIEKVLLDLASRGQDGHKDKVTVEGSGQLGQLPRLELKTTVAALEADPLLALAALLSGPAKTPEQRSVEQLRQEVVRHAAQQEGEKEQAPLVIASSLTIQRARYQRAELTEASGKLRLEGGVLDAQLDQGKLNGGTIKGKFGRDGSKIEPRLAWDLALEGVDVSALASIADPQWARRLTGKGEITTRGTGQGSGDTLRRTLQSESSFVIKDGELKNLPALDALAQQTRIAEFKDLKFSEFSGRASVADGTATLKDWVERGKEQMLSMEGTVGLDGTYNLIVQPAVGPRLAEKLGKSDLARQLMSDNQGYLSFPFQLAVTGKGNQCRVMPQVGAPTTAGGGTRLDESLRQAVGSALKKEVLDRQGKKRDDKAQAEEPGKSPARETAPTPPEQKATDQLGGLVNGLLDRKSKDSKKHRQLAPTPNVQDNLTTAANKVRIAPVLKNKANDATTTGGH